MPENFTTQSFSHVSAAGTSSNQKVKFNLKDSGKHVGHLRSMIKDEIVRLENLYQNIDNFMAPQEGSNDNAD